MKPLTIAVAIALFVVLVGVGAFAGTQLGGDSGAFTELWVTDTPRDTAANHHVPAARSIGTGTLVVVPVNGPATRTPCALVAVDASGSERWRTGMPTQACNIHAFGDPTIADLDGDGTFEVAVATTRAVVRVHDARTGREEFRRSLSGLGYTAPRVANLTADPGRELVVADLTGGVFVFSANGTRLWRGTVSTVVAPIEVGDVDADGTPEIAVAEGDNVTRLGPTGTIESRTRVGVSVTWMATGQADGDPAVEIVASTVDGTVAAVDGRTGAVAWTHRFNAMAAVHAFGDGDGDGRAEVYAVAQDAVLRSIDARTGSIEWSTTLTDGQVQMTPPPALGDFDGDGEPELLAVSQDGIVALVDPATGAIIDSYARDVPIWTRPAVADLDGDGRDEGLVMYGDGRVVALGIEPP